MYICLLRSQQCLQKPRGFSFSMPAKSLRHQLITSTAVAECGMQCYSRLFSPHSASQQIRFTGSPTVCFLSKFLPFFLFFFFLYFSLMKLNLLPITLKSCFSLQSCCMKKNPHGLKKQLNQTHEINQI